MVRLFKQFLSGQKGQALAIVLCLLAIGGLTIAVSLNYATTSLKGSQIVEEKTEGLYAAGAGVEYALWALTHDEWLIDPDDGPPLNPLVTELSENISGMTVGIQTGNEGTFTFYLGDLIYHAPPQVNVDWLEVSGNITEVSSGIYQYTVTLTLTEEGPQSLGIEAVGARLPVGYSYNATSAADFGNNISTDEPTTNTTDVHGAYMVNWEFSSPGEPKLTSSNSTQTQTFLITGTGSIGGHYACAEGDPASVGQVGEIQGTRYRITATATRSEDGKITAEIVADVIIRDDETIDIVSWQITK